MLDELHIILNTGQGTTEYGYGYIYLGDDSLYRTQQYQERIDLAHLKAEVIRLDEDNTKMYIADTGFAHEALEAFYDFWGITYPEGAEKVPPLEFDTYEQASKHKYHLGVPTLVRIKEDLSC